jgi:hypothetical protein
VGCGSATIVKEGKVAATDVNLSTIGRLYSHAQQQLGRPPKNADELKPFAKDAGDLDKLLVSPNDGKLYVIVWGAKILGAANQEMVVAYERTGANGFRHVLTPSGTQMMSHEEFARAVFPPGHRPTEP